VDFYPSPDPKEYARRKARVFSPRPDTLFFVPSVGLGYGLQDLLEQLPPRSAVLCMEVFPEVMAIAAARGLPSGDPRLLVVRTADAAGAAASLQRLGSFRRVESRPLCAGYRLAAETYDRLRRSLEEGIRRFWQNRLTLIALGSLQVRNLLANLGSLSADPAGAGDFSSLRTGMPVVVAGAGPSLEQSLPVLLRLRSWFTLAAVDTALPTLRAAGLRPDLVVALEAQASNLKDFIGTGDCPRTLVACDISANPALVRLFPGRTYLFSSRFAPLRIFDRLEKAGLLPASFPPLGSVGVAAVHAALRLTAGDIFLTGLDFSFPGHRTHARGSPSHLGMLAGSGRCRPAGQDVYAAMAARPLLPTEGKRGGVVLTDGVLRSYRDTLVDELAGSTGRVADIGQAGLPLGVALVDDAALEARLRSAPGGPPLGAEASGPYNARGAADFLTEESAILRRAADVLGSSEAEDAEILAEIDYAWVHFPDVPDRLKPDPGFLARARVAARWYAQRLERALNLPKS
jgi:hypothetical protein